MEQKPESKPEEVQQSSETVSVPAAKTLDDAQPQQVQAAASPQNASLISSISAAEPTAIAETSKEDFSDSDSEDESHALERSIIKVKSNRAMNQSMHGLSVILSEDMAAKRFPILELRSLLDQKGQMKSLNEILKEYMKNNMDLDKTIADLAEGIKKCKDDRQAKEKEINEVIRDITTAKVEVVNTSDTVRRTTSEAKILELKNKNLDKECQRAENEIRMLKLRIENLNLMIKDADEEIEKDRQDIEEMEPEKEKLKLVKEEMTKETRTKILELLKERKRNFLEPYNLEYAKREPTKDLAKLLAQYRRECLKEKALHPPTDLTDLQKKVALAEAAERELQANIKNLETTEETLNLTYLQVKAEINVNAIRIEEVNKQIETNRLNYEIELKKLDLIIECLSETNESLNKDYEEAYNYLIRVLLQDIGKKERIDEELRAMGIMLDWRLVKIKQEEKKAEKVEEAVPPKSGPGSTSSQRSSQSGKGSQRGGKGRGKGSMRK